MPIDYSKLPEHMQQAARDYINHGVPPGGFLRAVLENDFKGAVGRADRTNAMRLKDWASWVYWEAPSQCQGSEKIVKAWIEQGGLKVPIAERVK